MRQRRTTPRAPTRREERRNGSSLGVRHRSSSGLRCDPSSEHAMDVPAQIARYALDPIAATEEPEALAARRLDLEIIAHRPHLARAQPPFAMDALGTVARGDLIGFPAPAEPARRMIGKQRHDPRQHFGANEQAGGTAPASEEHTSELQSLMRIPYA